MSYRYSQETLDLMKKCSEMLDSLHDRIEENINDEYGNHLAVQESLDSSSEEDAEKVSKDYTAYDDFNNAAVDVQNACIDICGVLDSIVKEYNK